MMFIIEYFIDTFCVKLQHTAFTLLKCYFTKDLRAKKVKSVAVDFATIFTSNAFINVKVERGRIWKTITHAKSIKRNKNGPLSFADYHRKRPQWQLSFLRINFLSAFFKKGGNRTGEQLVLLS